MLAALSARVRSDVSREFGSDIFEPTEPLTPEEELEQLRSELRNGLTDMQRLFLFGKLGGLNDKEAALAAGYSVSVAENTKQRIWKPRVRAEFERLQSGMGKPRAEGKPSQMAPPTELNGVKYIILDMPRPHRPVAVAARPQLSSPESRSEVTQLDKHANQEAHLGSSRSSSRT